MREHLPVIEGMIIAGLLLEAPDRLALDRPTRTACQQWAREDGIELVVAEVAIHDRADGMADHDQMAAQPQLGFWMRANARPARR